MDKLKLIKTSNLNEDYICVVNEECSYLQGLCDNLGVSLITSSKFYFPKISIFDYRKDKRITSEIFENLIYKKAGIIKTSCSYNEGTIKKYERLFEEMDFVKDNDITLKAKILLKILDAEKKKISELEQIIE